MSTIPQIEKEFSSEELANVFKELIKTIENDELLSKKDLCERVLNMDVNTAEAHIINQKGFPYVVVGSLKRYPKKAVEEWIKENTKFIDY